MSLNPSESLVEITTMDRDDLVGTAFCIHRIDGQSALVLTCSHNLITDGQYREPTQDDLESYLFDGKKAKRLIDAGRRGGLDLAVVEILTNRPALPIGGFPLPGSICELHGVQKYGVHKSNKYLTVEILTERESARDRGIDLRTLKVKVTPKNLEKQELIREGYSGGPIFHSGLNLCVGVLTLGSSDNSSGDAISPCDLEHLPEVKSFAQPIQITPYETFKAESIFSLIDIFISQRKYESAFRILDDWYIQHGKGYPDEQSQSSRYSFYYNKWKDIQSAYETTIKVQVNIHLQNFVGNRSLESLVKAEELIIHLSKRFQNPIFYSDLHNFQTKIHQYRKELDSSFDSELLKNYRKMSRKKFLRLLVRLVQWILLGILLCICNPLSWGWLGGGSWFLLICALIVSFFTSAVIIFGHTGKNG